MQQRVKGANNINSQSCLGWAALRDLYNVRQLKVAVTTEEQH